MKMSKQLEKHNHMLRYSKHSLNESPGIRSSKKANSLDIQITRNLRKNWHYEVWNGDFNEDIIANNMKV